MNKNNTNLIAEYAFSKEEERQMRLKAKFDASFIYDVLDDLHKQSENI
jgi:hypothetical protein